MCHTSGPDPPCQAKQARRSPGPSPHWPKGHPAHGKGGAWPGGGPPPPPSISRHLRGFVINGSHEICLHKVYGLCNMASSHKRHYHDSKDGRPLSKMKSNFHVRIWGCHFQTRNFRSLIFCLGMEKLQISCQVGRRHS